VSNPKKSVANKSNNDMFSEEEELFEEEKKSPVDEDKDWFENDFGKDFGTVESSRFKKKDPADRGKKKNTQKI